MVEVLLNNQSLELDNDIDINYTLQVNDIGDVATRQASYINSIKIPRTPINTQILQGLGLVGDTSRVPYQKPTCQVIDDGFALIPNGWAVIKNTDANYYNIAIYNGIFNFFKAIENKTIGNDLDLSEINHQKNVQNVLSSFTNPNYRYLIGDYNGKTHYDVDNKILIDYLPPSANVKYLWNKIFSTFGFTYLGSVFNLPEFEDLWLTYPKGVEGNLTTTVVYESNDLEQNTIILNPLSALINTGVVIDNNNGTFTFTENCTVIIELSGSFSFIGYDNYNNQFFSSSFYIEILKSGLVIFTGANGSQLNATLTFTINDTISFNIVPTFSVYIFDYYYQNGSWQNFKVQKYNNLQSFSEELKEFKITDFVKEILNKYCLTMFTNDHTNEIIFKTIKERVETTDIIDWTDKYVERTNESYIYDTYAQKNTFEYQYNDKEDAHNDGFISIDNVNIPATTTVLKSIAYSPLKETNDSFIVGAGLLPAGQRIFKQYDKEVKDNATNTNAEVKYKPLSKRFYFLHSKPEYSPTGNVVFGSIQLTNTQTYNGSLIPVANFNQLDMNSIIGANYLPMQTILNDSRLHTILLNLSKFDVMTLNFKAVYYFTQEQQYYLLNKINFKNNDYSTGEFVRVKR